MSLPRYALYDGIVEDLFPKAQKAMAEGKFDKAAAYALLVLAAQKERDRWEKEMR
jgi:cytochrome c-type biogenesis protein CcmE